MDQRRFDKVRGADHSCGFLHGNDEASDMNHSVPGSIRKQHTGCTAVAIRAAEINSLDKVNAC